MKHLAFCIGLLCLQSIPSYAQEIITDRPDQTESAATVLPGSFQIESGFGSDWMSIQDVTIRHASLNSTLLRYGITGVFELRLGWDIDRLKIENTRGDAIASGLQPLSLGMKAQLYNSSNGLPDLALLVHVSLPDFASKDFKGQYLTPSFRFSFSHSLGPNLDLGYNFGLEWQDTDGPPSTIYTLALGRGITEQWGTYLEVFGNFKPDSQDEHLVNTGLTYLLKPTLQLDGSFGIGLTDDAVDGFWGVGISWLIANNADP
ncbi:MAG: transporter, partial [Saprospiraceae bacterium]|nr:transporter [Saprospiraceae bacterium]